MSVYEQMVAALRQKQRDDDEARAQRDAEVQAAVARKQSLIGAVLRDVQSMFFSAQQNDFAGLELGEGGTHYELRSGIFWFTVREDLGNLIVAYDAGFTGGNVIKLVPTADGSFHADDGTVIGSEAEAKNLIIKELLGWVQRHGIRTR